MTVLRMPFGKHKGELIEDLPEDYLYWCLENVEDLSPALQEEMEKQLQMKKGGGAAR
jgi:exodeoxyribonuclease X